MAALIGASVEAQLEQTLWKLLLGGVELHDCTPALSLWWTVAFEEGRASRQPEIDRLNVENDALYLRAFNPPERIKAILRARVDAGLAEHEREFFESSNA